VLRLNPDIGSGHSQRLLLAELAAALVFGTKYLPQVLDWQRRSGSTITRLQIHIGSGTDNQVWQQAIKKALLLIEKLPTITSLNMGGRL